APRHDDGRNIRKVLDNLQSNRAIARHDVHIVECVDVDAIDAWVSAPFEGLPPLVERDLDDLCTQPVDGFELGFWSRFRSNYCAVDPEAACDPSYALSHVARRSGQYSAPELFGRCMADCIGRAANLERADRLQVLELEVYFGRRLSKAQLHQRGPDRGTPNDLPRLED